MCVCVLERERNCLCYVLHKAFKSSFRFKVFYSYVFCLHYFHLASATNKNCIAISVYQYYIVVTLNFFSLSSFFGQICFLVIIRTVNVQKKKKKKITNRKLYCKMHMPKRLDFPYSANQAEA